MGAGGTTQAAYTQTADVYGALISQRRSGATQQYHFDALGSTMELSDAAQTVTDTWRYQAFGETLARTGSSANPFGFVGELGYYQEDGLGLHYVRARWYEARTGRWVSEDPVEGGNLYAYVGNWATRGVDPSGREPCIRPPKGGTSGSEGSEDFDFGTFKDWLQMTRALGWPHEILTKEAWLRMGKEGLCQLLRVETSAVWLLLSLRGSLAGPEETSLSNPCFKATHDRGTGPGGCETRLDRGGSSWRRCCRQCCDFLASRRDGRLAPTKVQRCKSDCARRLDPWDHGGVLGR